MNADKKAKLHIRALDKDDALQVARYYHGLSSSDYQRIGIDARRLTPAEDIAAQIASSMNQAVEDRRADYRLWCVDDVGVGFCCAKDIAYGDFCNMHLHIFRDAIRGKGFGGELFCRSALYFYETYQLKNAFCEPNAMNPMPNRMLEKVGFPLLETRFGKSSELTFDCTLNRYLVSLEVAKGYLGVANE